VRLFRKKPPILEGVTSRQGCDEKRCEILPAVEQKGEGVVPSTSRNVRLLEANRKNRSERDEKLARETESGALAHREFSAFFKPKNDVKNFGRLAAKLKKAGGLLLAKWEREDAHPSCGTVRE